MPPALTSICWLVALTLGATGVLARPPFAALTVLWQLRAPTALMALWLAALLAGLGRVPEAAALAGAAALVLVRIGVGRRRARVRNGAAGPSASLHVLTHNCGLSRSDPRRVAEFIADCGADLVGLQEIRRENALALAEHLRRTHPFQVLHATGVDVRDLARLAERARERAPAIMLGDLNSTDATAAWDVVARAGFVDTFRAVGSGGGATFPVPFKYLGLPVPPLVRIDFIFATPDLGAGAWPLRRATLRRLAEASPSSGAARAG